MGLFDRFNKKKVYIQKRPANTEELFGQAWLMIIGGKEKAEARIQTLAEEIRSAGELKRQKENRRRLSRAAAKREREQMLERQAALEDEIKRMYPTSNKIRAKSYNV